MRLIIFFFIFILFNSSCKKNTGIAPQKYFFEATVDGKNLYAEYIFPPGQSSTTMSASVTNQIVLSVDRNGLCNNPAEPCFSFLTSISSVTEGTYTPYGFSLVLPEGQSTYHYDQTFIFPSGQQLPVNLTVSVDEINRTPDINSRGYCTGSFSGIAKKAAFVNNVYTYLGEVAVAGRFVLPLRP